MLTAKVKFDSVMEIKQFVQSMMNLPYPMDVVFESTIVDAKSLLGILYLGLGKTLELHVYTDKKEELDTIVESYLVDHKEGLVQAMVI